MDVRSPRQVAAADMVGGLAIRQPAVIYLLQRELWSSDGDAFASGLELATRLFAQVAASAGQPATASISQGGGRRLHPGRYAARRACARLQPVDAAYGLLAPVALCERFGYAKCRPRQQ